MKRIAYLCLSDGWGGLEMNQLRNALQMQKRGHDVLLITNSSSPVAKAAEQDNIPIYIVDQKAKHYQWLFAWQLAVKLLKEGRRDLFFRNNRELSIAASVQFFSSGRVRSHYFMEMAMGGIRTQFFRTLRYKFIHTWVCPLPYLVNQVKQQSRVAENKINLIHSGVSMDRQTYLNPIEARNKLGWPTDKKIMVVVGRIDLKKRQHFIWESFCQRPSLNELLVFVGAPTPDQDSSYHTSLLESIKSHPKSNQVLWSGFHRAMDLVYSAADLVIMAADHETVGMVTIEALFNDCIIVGSKNGGTREIIETYGGGLCFTPNDQNELNQQLDSALQGHVPPINRSLFEQHFDFNYVCERVETEILGS